MAIVEKILAVFCQGKGKNEEKIQVVPKTIRRPNWVDDIRTPQTTIDEWYREMKEKGITVV